MGYKRARERRREPDDTAETESKPEHQNGDTDREEPQSERRPGVLNRSTVDTSGRRVTAGGAGGTERGAGPASGYVEYERGPDRAALSARYGMEVQRSEAERLRRLESEHGSDRVGRWADEGMPVDTMGRPRDMQAFRERQADRSTEIPADIERRNQASVRRNAARTQQNGSAGATGTPDAVRRVVSSPGRSMNESVQREMESKMGGDFSDVQVHTGPQAAAAAESIHARAFTVGNHIAFNRGEYQPGSNDGKRVLAHELTHVRQQTDGRVSMLPKADAEGSTRAAEMHVQPRLEVSSPDDPAEKEAREVAEQVMQMDEEPGQTEQSGPNGPSRTPSEMVRTVPAQRSAASSPSSDTESTVKDGISTGGKPLPSRTRSEMEAKMGADFSNVRIHTGPQADTAAKSINAKAYTMGSDIAFASNNYNPDSQSGQKLLAHELTHVQQQTGASNRSAETNRVPAVLRAKDSGGGSGGNQNLPEDEEVKSAVKAISSNASGSGKLTQVPGQYRQAMLNQLKNNGKVRKYAADLFAKDPKFNFEKVKNPIIKTAVRFLMLHRPQTLWLALSNGSQAAYQTAALTISGSAAYALIGAIGLPTRAYKMLKNLGEANNPLSGAAACMGSTYGFWHRVNRISSTSPPKWVPKNPEYEQKWYEGYNTGRRKADELANKSNKIAASLGVVYLMPPNKTKQQINDSWNVGRTNIKQTVRPAVPRTLTWPEPPDKTESELKGGMPEQDELHYGTEKPEGEQKEGQGALGLGLF